MKPPNNTHRGFDHTTGRVAVEGEDARRERSVVGADAHGHVELLALLDEGNEGVNLWIIMEYTENERDRVNLYTHTHTHMYTYMYIHVYTHTHTHTHTHTYIYIYIYIYISISISISISIYIYIYIYVCIYISIKEFCRSEPQLSFLHFSTSGTKASTCGL